MWLCGSVKLWPPHNRSRGCPGVRLHERIEPDPGVRLHERIEPDPLGVSAIGFAQRGDFAIYIELAALALDRVGRVDVEVGPCTDSSGLLGHASLHCLLSSVTEPARVSSLLRRRSTSSGASMMHPPPAPRQGPPLRAVPPPSACELALAFGVRPGPGNPLPVA